MGISAFIHEPLDEISESGSLVWDDLALPSYESGIQNVVFYPKTGPGQAWMGVQSIIESKVGGGRTSLYFDGQKYMDLVGDKEFAGTLTSFTIPRAFSACIGEPEIIPGFFLTHQVKETFGLCYRTMVDQEDFKLHLLYNVTASQKSRDYLSLADSPTPTPFSFQIDAVPVAVPNASPAAHFIIDSRYFTDANMQNILNILYGTSTTDPRLPTLSELAAAGAAYRTVIVIPTPTSPLPLYASVGDLVFSQSDYTVYSYGTPDPSVRPAVVIHTSDPLSSDVITGDIIYDEDTGLLYKVGADV